MRSTSEYLRMEDRLGEGAGALGEGGGACAGTVERVDSLREKEGLGLAADGLDEGVVFPRMSGVLSAVGGSLSKWSMTIWPRALRCVRGVSSMLE